MSDAFAFDIVKALHRIAEALEEGNAID